MSTHTTQPTSYTNVTALCNPQGCYSHVTWPDTLTELNSDVTLLLYSSVTGPPSRLCYIHVTLLYLPACNRKNSYCTDTAMGSSLLHETFARQFFEFENMGESEKENVLPVSQSSASTGAARVTKKQRWFNKKVSDHKSV